MNESLNRGTAGEAVIGIFFIFAILLFMLYQFGTSKESVGNPNAANTPEISKEEFLRQLDSTGAENELYNSYLKQVYEAQSSTDNELDKQKKIEELVNNFKNSLDEKVYIPTQTVYLKNVSDKFDTKYYSQNFEIIFEDFKKRGGTSESAIFQAQIGPEGNILALSDFDKESLLRIATEYEVLSQKLQNLSTPTSLEKIATEVATYALNVSYILKKMVDEKDSKVYSLWISKYAENMSVIIADRYAINAK